MATRTGNRSSTARSTHRSPVQVGSLIVGAMFVVVGIAGFIPGITTNYGQLEWAGPDSQAMLLGIFMVSILHNLLHLGLGVLGLVAAKSASAARSFLIAGGLVYAALWIYGLVVAEESQANFVPLNNADDWLHLVLAVGMILLGLVLPRRVELPASEH
ncbi:DUF4383 domain-containing protein [Kineococcus sp. SYSU DK018]|uniref:DUF4383 domain-containing protein n=1 Tax=Kineococcus sp. SYSU DK018 TaxID=3383139 RepID=UPI003D7C84FA